MPQVIVSCCCEPLALCPAQQSQQAASLLTDLGTLAQLYASRHLQGLALPAPGPPEPTETLSLERKSCSSQRDSSAAALTPSALSFLKSGSRLLAIVACLRASRGSKVTKPILSWKELRGLREAPLSAEQVVRECEHLLDQFPLLEASLRAAWEPLRAPARQVQNLAASLCGQTSVSPVLLGLHAPNALEVLTEAFEEALGASDWLRALQLLDTYGRDADDLSPIKDTVLSCAAACGEQKFTSFFSLPDQTTPSSPRVRCPRISGS